MTPSGPAGVESEPEGEGKLYKLGFYCNLCGNHRTVFIEPESGNSVDFRTGTDYSEGDTYIIVITPGAVQQNIIQAVGKAHFLTLHPGSSRPAEIWDVRN